MSARKDDPPPLLSNLRDRGFAVNKRVSSARCVATVNAPTPLVKFTTPHRHATVVEGVGAVPAIACRRLRTRSIWLRSAHSSSAYDNGTLTCSTRYSS